MSIVRRLPPVLNFSRRRDHELAVAEAYRRIVGQARLPSFYAECGVPDTLDGRFELVVLHAALVFRRLKDEAEAADFAQQLFDHLFADMDQSLREMGVGDLSVGKHIKRMAEGFYGRVVAYDKALSQVGQDDLASALMRNLYGTVEADPDAISIMVDYVRQQAAQIAGQSVDAIMAGQVIFGAAPGTSRQKAG